MENHSDNKDRRSVRGFFTLLLFLLASVSIACSGILATPIKKIIDNPRDYDGKTVTVSGKVTGIFSLFVLKYFVVDDGTGKITVITRKALPKKGTKIRVKGEVSAMFSLGETQALVIIEGPDKKMDMHVKEKWRTIRCFLW